MVEIFGMNMEHGVAGLLADVYRAVCGARVNHNDLHWLAILVF